LTGCLSKLKNDVKIATGPVTISEDSLQQGTIVMGPMKNPVKIVYK